MGLYSMKTSGTMAVSNLAFIYWTRAVKICLSPVIYPFLCP